MTGDQAEGEREEVESAAQSSRIDRFLGSPLASRALLLALLPSPESPLLLLFLLLLSLIFLFLTDLQFKVLWSLLDRSDSLLSNGDDSEGVFHRHL